MLPPVYDLCAMPGPCTGRGNMYYVYIFVYEGKDIYVSAETVALGIYLYGLLNIEGPFSSIAS